MQATNYYDHSADFHFDEDMLNYYQSSHINEAAKKSWCISNCDSRFEDIMEHLKCNDIIRKLTIENCILGLNAFSALSNMLVLNKSIKSIVIKPSIRGVSVETLQTFCKNLNIHNALHNIEISLSYITGGNIANVTDISIPDIFKAIVDMLSHNNTLRHLKLCIEQPISVGTKQDISELFPMVKKAIRRADSKIATLELSYTWYNHNSESDRMHVHNIMDQEIKDLLLANKEKSDLYYR